MDKKELMILSQFRRNARENLTTASRRTHIPISTLYDRLRKYEGTIIRKHTSLLDFAKIGYGLKMQMVIKVAPKDRKRLQEFLTKHPRVNSLFSISNGYDFIVELILKNLLEVSQFAEILEQFNVLDKHEFFVVEDIKREDFLMDPELIDHGFTQESFNKLIQPPQVPFTSMQQLMR
ncbi:MAG TPA: Lrp/AsnC family transcriptional regulator [Acidobacteriota bacterium]|nr:Lrp/AsnC family transcriptional regulator [Acidobacteriota bacterium]